MVSSVTDSLASRIGIFLGTSKIYFHTEQGQILNISKILDLVLFD